MNETIYNGPDSLGEPPRGLPLPCWIISDTHFGHENIIRYAGRPDDHEQRMLDAWTTLIADDDHVLHLGDWFMGKRDRFADQIRPRLTGHLHTLIGNHDRQSRGFYTDLAIQVHKPFLWTHKGWRIIFTHRPAPEAVTFPNTLNVHGHIHEKTMSDRRMISVCVEQTDYRPVRLDTLVEARILELTSPGA